MNALMDNLFIAAVFLCPQFNYLQNFSCVICETIAGKHHYFLPLQDLIRITTPLVCKLKYILNSTPPPRVRVRCHLDG
jgi:hypothetical protein